MKTSLGRVEGRTVSDAAEPDEARQLPRAVLIEIAVGAVMECRRLDPTEARRYVLDRAGREERDVFHLARDIVTNRSA